MRWFWTVDDGERPVHDVVVRADPDTSVAAIAGALGLRVDQLAAGCDPEAAAADAAPFSGARLPPHAPPPAPGSAIRFRAGLLAGHVVSLRGLRLAIGRAPDNDLVLADPSVSRHHAILTMNGRGVQLSAASPDRPVLVNGAAVAAEGQLLEPDDLVEVGGSVFSVGPAPAEPADLRRDGSGELAFNRPSRIRGRQFEHRVLLAGARPESSARAPMPWAMAAVPVGAAGAMVLVTGQPTMLFMAAASPVMVFANYQAQRRTSTRRESSALSKWQQARQRASTELAAVIDKQRTSAWLDLPDPATVCAICTQRDVRLWERRLGDPDALVLRVGVAEVPVEVTLDASGAGTGERAKPPVMSPAPVPVDLARAGVFGAAGPPEVTGWLGRWLVLQLVALRSPRDLRLVVLCDAADEPGWSWLRWLPHLRVDAPQAPLTMVGNDDEMRAARVRELAKEIEIRQQVRRDQPDAVFDRQVVVVIDGARRLRTLPGMTALLRHGPQVGVFSICLDDDRSRLPEEVSAELIVDATQPSMALLAAAGQAPVHRLLVDGVSARLADAAARAMAPIQHVGGDGDATALPGSVRLVELLELDLDSAPGLAARWTLAPRSTAAVVGAGLDGPFSLDLKRDGPHTLIAGTTGAGKSEFLQTLVLSLALNNRPDALTFVLVDYKGAAAFAECEQLPHTVGMVTNLDNHETQRALESLDAELRRREVVLKSIGARDIDEAWDRDADRAAGGGLARLVVVIDEFAELVHELPEFVAGLIRIARVGRSLGVHLVLATQRPAGVVSAEMQANVGLRVAFRMATMENSAEVLGSQEAALISTATPGRGLVRRGGGVAPEAFQSARVSGRRPGVHAAAARPPSVQPLDWAGLGYAAPALPPRAAGDDDRSASDLHGLVRLIADATAALGIARNASPWLPALPALVTVDQIAARVAPGRHSAPDDATDGVLLGLLDVPSEQAQVALRYRVQDGGHLLIAGSARSGRSSALRTLIAGLGQAFGPDDLHLYGIDFGNAQRPMRDLPHCGALVSGLETERITRLLARVQREIAHRKIVLAEGGFGDVGEQRASAGFAHTALPYLVILIDTWDGLGSAYPLEQLQVVREQVIKILREGPATGITMVITGDHGLLNDRVASFVTTRYALRLADRESYRLVGVRPGALPETVPTGRAYFGDPTREAQFALLSRDDSGAGQSAALSAVVDSVRSRYLSAAAVQRPFRVDVLPDVIGLDTAAGLPVAGPSDGGAMTVLVGVGGDELSQYRVGFGAGPGFLIAGQRGSGRSTALACIALDLSRQGVAVCVVAAKASPARAMASRIGALLVDATDEVGAAGLSGWLGGHEQCAVLVDDADLVHGTPVDDLLIEATRARPAGRFALVVAGLVDDLAPTLRGVLVEAKRSKQGVLLSPTSALDGNALGTGIRRELLGRAAPGRALFPVNGDYLVLQVPVPPAGAP